MAELSIPKLDQFCCFELRDGVKFASVVLCILWTQALITTLMWGSVNAYFLWSAVWCLATIVVYAMVFNGISNNKAQIF